MAQKKSTVAVYAGAETDWAQLKRVYCKERQRVLL